MGRSITLLVNGKDLVAYNSITEASKEIAFQTL